MHGASDEAAEQGERSSRSTPGRLARWAAAIAFALTSFLLATAPLYLVYRANSGSAGLAALMRAGQGRSVVGAELAEVRVSDGFAELARIASLAPEPPTWEPLRTMIERRGWSGMWYSLRVRSRLDDGGCHEVVYIRRPCQDPRPLPQEFLKLLTASAGLPVDDEGRLALPSREIDLRPDLVDAPSGEVIMHLLRRAKRP